MSTFGDFTTIATIQGPPGPSSAGISVKDYGATGLGIVDDGPFITAAIAAAGNLGLFFPVGTYKVSTNVVGSAGHTWTFDRGATLSIDSGKTVTSPTIIAGPDQQIFSGTGTVALVSGSNPHVYPDWWGTSGIQAAANAASLSGTQLRLRATQYILDSGSVGLSLPNPNTSIVGDGAVGDATTAITGAELYYSGTGTAVLVGAGSGTVFVENVQLKNFSIKTNDNCAIALNAWAPADSVFERLTIFGPSGSGNFCLKVNQGIHTVFRDMKINGTGRAGSAVLANYAQGASVLPVAGSPTTTTLFDGVYFHGCNTCLKADTSIANTRNCIFETSVHGIVTINSSKVDCEQGHFENTGKDSIPAEGVANVGNGTLVAIRKSIVILDASCTLAFLTNTTGSLHLDSVSFQSGAASTLFNSSSSAATSIIKMTACFLDSNTKVADSGGTANETPSWRAAVNVDQRVVAYRFKYTNVVTGLTSAAVPTADAYAGNNVFATGAGHILGASIYYSATMSAGAYQVVVKVNGSTKFDTTTATSLPNFSDHTWDRNSVSIGDLITVELTTNGSFATTGGDMIVEVYVGYGA